jgi:diguanylate cyclase (GGDEF)-like protein/PAS domain S-box-containing protein
MNLSNPVSVQDQIFGINLSLADTLSVGLFFTDITGLCLYVNSKWLEISGLTRDETLGEGWSKAIHSDDRDRIISEWVESIKSDREFISEYRFQKHDKTIIWVIGQANKYKDINGNVLGYVGTITDITESKNTETSLHQLAKGFSVVSSSEFFRFFSIHLGEVLDIDYVVVSEITDELSGSVKSVVVNHRGEILDPIEYLLQGTPCETVVGKSVKGYEYGIQKLFPDFDLLKALGAEGYVGTPLFDSANKPIGIIAVLDSRPIENIQMVENVLQIYAIRASAELERKQNEEVLQELNKELGFKQFTVDHMSESLFWVDKDTKIYDVNNIACLELGYTREELLQLSIPDINPVFSLEMWKQLWEEVKNDETKITESKHITKEGRIFPVEVTVNYIKYNDKEYQCAIVRDITKRKQNEQERENSLSLQNAILEATADGILAVSLEGEITSYNQQFIKIWGFSEKIFNRKNAKKALASAINKVREPDKFINRVNEIYKDTNEDSFDTVELLDGRIIERYSRPQKIEDKIVGRVWSFRDITEKHKLSEQLSYQATHDPLTGLVNRREFEKRLQRFLSSIDTKSSHVVCYMDLDNFKQINDVYGHIAGDYLLIKISDLFLEQVRGRDTLARLGGDEFGLIMEHCTVEQAEKVATNFIRAINEYELKWENNEFNIGVSIGVVKINSQSVDLLEIMKKADIACYTAKKLGRNCVHVSLD